MGFGCGLVGLCFVVGFVELVREDGSEAFEFRACGHFEWSVDAGVFSCE